MGPHAACLSPHLVVLGQAVAALDHPSTRLLEDVGHGHQLGPRCPEGQSLGVDLVSISFFGEIRFRFVGLGWLVVFSQGRRGGRT